jgi:hypothetical protein
VCHVYPLTHNNNNRRMVEDCSQIIKKQQVIEARVLSIDYKSSPPVVHLTCKSSMLANNGPLVTDRIRRLMQMEEFLVPEEAFDQNYVAQRTQARRGAQADAEDEAEAMRSLNRLIVHPRFKNLSYAATTAELADKPRGAVLFRPSSKVNLAQFTLSYLISLSHTCTRQSKGYDFISLTWRFWGEKPDGTPIFVTVSIAESEKPEQRLALGAKLTLVKKDSAEMTFSSINEVYERYVRPINRYLLPPTTHSQYLLILILLCVDIAKILPNITSFPTCHCQTPKNFFEERKKLILKVTQHKRKAVNK